MVQYEGGRNSEKILFWYKVVRNHFKRGVSSILHINLCLLIVYWCHHQGHFGLDFFLYFRFFSFSLFLACSLSSSLLFVFLLTFLLSFLFHFNLLSIFPGFFLTSFLFYFLSPYFHSFPFLSFFIFLPLISSFFFLLFVFISILISFSFPSFLKTACLTNWRCEVEFVRLGLIKDTTELHHGKCSIGYFWRLTPTTDEGQDIWASAAVISPIIHLVCPPT